MGNKFKTILDYIQDPTQSENNNNKKKDFNWKVSSTYSSQGVVELRASETCGSCESRSFQGEL